MVFSTFSAFLYLVPALCCFHLLFLFTICRMLSCREGFLWKMKFILDLRWIAVCSVYFPFLSNLGAHVLCQHLNLLPLNYLVLCFTSNLHVLFCIAKTLWKGRTWHVYVPWIKEPTTWYLLNLTWLHFLGFKPLPWTLPYYSVHSVLYTFPCGEDLSKYLFI